MNLRQPDEAGIRQRHRTVAVSIHQRSQVRLLLLHGERDLYYPPFQESEDCIGSATLPVKQECRLGKDRFAGEER